MIYTADFIKIDMHVHTHYSYSSTITLGYIEKFLCKNVDFGLAITDNNCIDGALALQKKYPNRIIVGSQIQTRQGNITGLFLRENIPSGRDISWTMDAILVQNGLIYLPHPCDRSRTPRLSPESLSLALKRCDILEIYNSRTIYIEDDIKARNLLNTGMVPACGSDAHTKQEVGLSYIRSPLGMKLSPAGLLDGLSQGELVCKKASTFVHMFTKIYRTYKRQRKK